MPNKKINQLDARVGGSLTDLSLIGDPTTGTSFKLTLTQISTIMGVPGKFNQPTGTTLQYLRGDGTLATFPSLTGFVPYTGATANVDLGVHTILAQNATFASNGSGNTATINHSSGSGIALNITKGGNGEGLYVNKTSGSGNAATILGTLNATTLVKNGGLSTEYLKADGSVSTLTNPITGTGASGQVAYWSGASTQVGSNNLFWDNTNGRLGIGTNSPSHPINILSSNAALGFRLEQASPSSAAFPFQITNSADTNYIRANVNVIEFLRNGGASTIRTKGSSNDLLLQSFRNLQLAINDGTIAAQLHSTGNLALGNPSVDSTQRLQVTGDTLLKGSGATSATTALTVQNSDGNLLMSFNNAGSFLFGPNGQRSYIAITDALSTLGLQTLTLQSNLTISNTRVTTQSLTNGVLFITRDGIETSTVGTDTKLLLIGHRASDGFAPTSGTAIFMAEVISPRINQTGGANGITRGLYINPTLTAAADWRSIETSNNSGWAFYGAGSAPSYFGGAISIGNTSTSSAAARVFLTYDATRTWGVRNDGTILSGAVNSIYYTSATRIGASVATTSVTHFDSSEISIGAGATITNQFGFVANSSLTSATNNYGFYGNIASGTGRWNLFMNGTAANFLSGNTQIGTGSFTSDKLQVNGTMKVTGAATFSSIVTAGSNSSVVGSVILRGNYTNGILATFGTDGSSGAPMLSYGVESAQTSTQGAFVSSTALSSLVRGAYTISGTHKWYTAAAQTVAVGSAVTMTKQLELYNSGNLVLGGGADDGVNRLQVTGAATFSSSVTAESLVVDTTTLVVDATNNRLGVGTTTPQTNIQISDNKNGITSLQISNTTAGTASQAGLRLDSDASSGTMNLGKYSSTSNSYLSISPTDGYLSNSNFGDITIQNEVVTGRIKFAAGGSSTAHLTIASTGAATFSSSVQAGGGTTNASAILQADSTTKGFLPPRMTTTQKNAIVTPSAGLMVYDTTVNKLYVFTTAWEMITSL